YSGGGIATTWAAQVQPSYAPELNVAGMAVGAPVPDFAAAIMGTSLAVVDRVIGPPSLAKSNHGAPVCRTCEGMQFGA
ncbi:hypothetical protein GV794_29170, partial [Nocardia cyriacigeorgica]|nr:hypothetical protein [Nocardia cyriacigeorgica]